MVKYRDRGGGVLLSRIGVRVLCQKKLIVFCSFRKDVISIVWAAGPS